MVNEEDKLLFKKAFDNLNIKHSKEEVFNKEKKSIKKELFNSYSYINNANISGLESVIYQKDGASKKIIKKMKKGDIDIFPILDLHGQTIKQSCKSLSNFIHYHRKNKIIQIIHGKGNNSSNGLSIVKSQVVYYLKQHPQVMAFCSCPQKYGGTGAVFVYLKNNV